MPKKQAVKGGSITETLPKMEFIKIQDTILTTSRTLDKLEERIIDGLNDKQTEADYKNVYGYIEKLKKYAYFYRFDDIEKAMGEILAVFPYDSKRPLPTLTKSLTVIYNTVIKPVMLRGVLPRTKPATFTLNDKWMGILHTNEKEWGMLIKKDIAKSTTDFILDTVKRMEQIQELNDNIKHIIMDFEKAEEDYVKLTGNKSISKQKKDEEDSKLKKVSKFVSKPEAVAAILAKAKVDGMSETDTNVLKSNLELMTNNDINDLLKSSGIDLIISKDTGQADATLIRLKQVDEKEEAIKDIREKIKLAKFREKEMEDLQDQVREKITKKSDLTEDLYKAPEEDKKDPARAALKKRVKLQENINARLPDDSNDIDKTTAFITQINDLRAESVATIHKGLGAVIGTRSEIENPKLSGKIRKSNEYIEFVKQYKIDHKAEIDAKYNKKDGKGKAKKRIIDIKERNQKVNNDAMSAYRIFLNGGANPTLSFEGTKDIIIDDFEPSLTVEPEEPTLTVMPEGGAKKERKPNKYLMFVKEYRVKNKKAIDEKYKNAKGTERNTGIIKDAAAAYRMLEGGKTTIYEPMTTFEAGKDEEYVKIIEPIEEIEEEYEEEDSDELYMVKSIYCKDPIQTKINLVRSQRPIDLGYNPNSDTMTQMVGLDPSDMASMVRMGFIGDDAELLRLRQNILLPNTQDEYGIYLNKGGNNSVKGHSEEFIAFNSPYHNAAKMTHQYVPINDSNIAMNHTIQHNRGAMAAVREQGALESVMALRKRLNIG